MKKSIKKVGNILLFITSVFFVSCEIGLGASVDTEAPVITITGPTTNAIIRDSFAIKGSWTDDGTVDNIKVSIRRTDGVGSPIDYDATVSGSDGSGEWAAIINPSEESIIDGSYEATVTATDGGGHTVNQTRTFTIDNTAPLIVLQRPGTKITQTPDAYGRTFSFVGSAGEDNLIDHIDVNIYSDEGCTNLLKTVTRYNVPQKMQVNIAVFGDEDYTSIYGSDTNAGTKNFYCKITAYDNAKRYPIEGESTDDDEKGNSTSTYYLYDDIYTGVLESYPEAEVYKMLNGTYLISDENRSAATVESVIGVLNQKKITESNFSLNPKNNPYFIVNGRDPLPANVNLNGEDYSLTNGTSLVVEISMGLDEIPLNADSLRPYLLPCNSSGEASVDNTAENRIYLWTATDEDAGSTKVKSGNSYKFTVNLDSTKTYANEKTLSVGSCYIFGVEGSDTKGNVVEPKNSNYGFRLASNGSAPSLTVTSPEKAIAYIKKDGSIHFTGIVSCQEGLPYLVVRDGETEVYRKNFTEAEASTVGGRLQYAFDREISFNGVTENCQKQYTIAACQNGMETTSFKTLIYDKDAPEISIDSMLPTAKKYGTSEDPEGSQESAEDYLNGQVKLKLSIVDDYDSVDVETNKPYFEILDVDNGNAPLSVKVGSETVNCTQHFITTPAKQTFDIDTTQSAFGTSSKNIKIRIYAWDRSGNKYKNASGNEYFEAAYTVDQSTDNPVIRPNDSASVSLLYKTHEACQAAIKSSFASGGQLLLKLIDDDGIASVDIYCARHDATDAVFQASKKTKDFNPCPTETTYSFQLPTTATEYRLRVVVKDKNWTATNTEHTITDTEEFYVKVTAAAPSVDSITSNASYITNQASANISSNAKTSFTNTININGSGSTFYFFRKTSPFEESDIQENQNPVTSNNQYYVGSSNTSTYQDIYDAEDSKKTALKPSQNTTFYYEVMDENFHKSGNRKYVVCKVDNVSPANPTITIPALVVSPTPAVSVSGSEVTFTGNASDAEAGSGESKSRISKINFAITTSNADAEAFYSIDASEGKWNLNLNLHEGSGTNTISDSEISLYEGHYWLQIKAEDAAGNLSEIVKREFYVDQNLPAIETKVTRENEDDEVVTDTTRKLRTASYTFKYKASDTYGLAENPYTVTVKKDNVLLPAWTEAAPNGYKDVAGSENDEGWRLVTIEGSAAGDGTYEYTVVAKDQAQRTSTVTRTVLLDTSAPVISIVSPSLEATDYQNTAAITVNGSAEDVCGVAHVYYQYLETSAAAPTTTLRQTDFTGWTEVTSGTTSWKITGNPNAEPPVASPISGIDGQTKMLYVCAVDTNGLVSGVTSKTVNFDLNNPILTSGVKKTSSQVVTTYSSLNTNEGFTLTGTCYDANGIASISISDGTNTYTTDESSSPRIQINPSTSLENAKSEQSAASWSLVFSITKDERSNGTKEGELSDGSYTFTVTTTDPAGKTDTKQLSVLIDTINPANVGPTIVWANNDSPAEGIPHKVAVATLTSSASDTNLDGLYYYIWDKSAVKTKEGLTDAEWNVLTSGTAKTISFSDGDGYIWVKAIDKAGNVVYTENAYAVDTSAPETVNNCSITGSTLTNAADPLVFTLTAKDKDNGYTISGESVTANGDKADRVDSVKVIYLCGSDLNEAHYISGVATLENEVKTGVWTITIPVATLEANNNNSGAVKVRATDKAGNYKDYELFTLEVDKTAPTVDIAMPTASTLNGSAVSMSGNVTEKNPKSISLYYRTTVPSAATLPTAENSGWNFYKKITSESAPETNPDANTTYGASASSIYYWNYSVNFNSLSGAASSQATGYKKDIYWLAFAEDTAGNTSSMNFGTEASPQYYTKKYTVDIDADRPVILVMGSVNLQGKDANDAAVDMSSTSRVGITSNSLLLNVSDDDGITSFGYRFGSTGDYTTLTGNGSTYTIPFAQDGTKDIYFKIVDSAGTIFESTTSTVYSWSSPKITDGSHNYGYYNSESTAVTKATVLYATVDTSAPLTQALEYRITNSAYAYAENTEWSSGITSTTFGGSKKQYMKLRQYAYDINNIASIKLAVEGIESPISFTKSTETNDEGNVVPVTQAFTVDGNSLNFEEWTANINVGSGTGGLTLTSGTHTCTLTVSDGVNSKSSTVVLIVDNDAPTVSITSPAANDDPVYGSIVARGSSEAGATLYYTLSLDGTNAPSTDVGKTNSKWTGYNIDENGIRTSDVTAGTFVTGQSYSVADYVEFDDDKGLSWTIYFDGNTTNLSATHINKLLDYLTDSFGVTNTTAITNNTFTSIVNIYLWIKAVDEVGNAVEVPFLIKLDPQGGRPTVSIDYPEKVEADGEIDSFGGNFKVYGSAEDLEEGIDSVWIQILSRKHRTISGSDPYEFTNALDTSTTFGAFEGPTTNNTVTSFTVKAADLDYWAKAGYTVAKMKKTNGVHTAWVVGSSVTDAEAAEYGIQADVTGATWRKLINSKSEFSPLESGDGVANDDTKANLAMRVYSYDGGKLSYPKTKQFVIDNDKPYITNVKLEQFESISAQTSTASRNYSSGICVKGDWYLTFTANDNQHVNNITVLVDNNPVSSSYIQVTNGTANGSYYPQKYVRVKLDTGSTNSVGSYDIKVTVTDTNDTNTKEEEYTVKYDNKAPRIANTINSSYALKPKVQQSNGFYTMKSFVSDAETGVNPSGIDSVAFFFMRRTSTAAGQIYDPMLIRPSSAAEGLVDTSSSGITYEEGLFWKTINGSLSGSVFTMSASDPNVHKGGLCKIGGVNYKIADLSESAVTLDGEPAVSATSAKFALAMIVNNTVAEFANGEKSADGYYAAPGNDDGDRMIEYIDGTSVEATWEAQIVSKNIPDGPIEIHYVAFDKAGNYSIGIVGNEPWETYKAYTSEDAVAVKDNTLSSNSMANFVYAYDSANKAYVSNNAPRVVGVVVGTDFNGDGDMSDEGETITKYYSSAEGKPNDVISNYIVSSVPDQSLAKNGKGIFTLKNASEIRPEIIGGNGQLYYEYNISAQNTYLAPSSIENYVKDATLDNNKLKKRNSSGELVDAEGSDAFDDYLDSSDGSIASSKIVNAVIPFSTAVLAAENVAWSTKALPTWFTIRIWDSTAGTTPFTNSQYASLQIALANQTKDNIAPNVAIDPFFWNSHSDNSLYNNSYENGHITLSKDLVESYTSETYVDPKVSGKVSFRGTVCDDHDIKSIWAKFGAIECSNPVGSAAADDGYYKVAEKDDSGVWTTCGSGTTVPSGAAWNFQILSTVYTEEGQTVSWQLDIDTSALASGFADDVNLKMKARDAIWASASDDANHQSSATKTDGTTPGYEVYSATSYNVPYYQVDVVPYIKGIKGANRSRLGKYSVRAGESVTVEGFNFGTAAPSVYRDKTNVTTGLADEGTANVVTVANGNTTTSFTITVPQYSGFIHAVWGSVSTPNNTSASPNTIAYNIQEGYVASNDLGLSEANSKGSNFWTDDVYLSVWNNIALDGSTNPWDGKVKQLDSKDLINNTTYYKNKSGTGIDSVTGAVNTWSATWSSPDMIMYTTMGNGGCSKYRTMWNDSQAQFTFPVRTMDWAVIGGKNWYVVRDDYVGNSSANVWGPGLFLGNEGFSFPKGGWNSTNQPSDSEAYNIIERLGSNLPADSRNPATGYDSVQEQFQNPHITGWYDGTSHTYNNGSGNQTAPGYTYIYVSYYDSFAKCLKYAAYKEDWSSGSTGSSTKWGSENGSKNLTKLARAADNMTEETVVVAGVDRLFSPASSDFTTANGADCGLYNDIMVDPTDHYPVIIYYNKTTGTLEVAHGKQAAPVTANYKTAAGSFTDTTEDSTGWSKTKGLTPVTGHDFGRYVSAEIDSNGNIHASAQDFTTGALYYIFLEKSGTTYTATYKMIDSECTSAVWTDIRLNNDENTNTNWYEYEPVISYVDESKKLPKVAYVDSERGTGIFEALSDANIYESTDMKTSVMSDIYEGATTGTKSKIGVAFNSSMLAIDFLRDEQ
ncbi:MAG: hypothetical protein K6C97_08915 [Treponema sp.]|nr:hypothetical protein [Treponema sp.]